MKDAVLIPAGKWALAFRCILLTTALVCLIAFCASAECPVAIQPGWHHVILTSHYMHRYPQDGEITWSSTVNGGWVYGPDTLYAGEDTNPMGHQWVMDMMLAGECGTIPAPNMIFANGFETGDTYEWSATIGD